MHDVTAIPDPCTGCGAPATHDTWCTHCAPSWVRVVIAAIDLRLMRARGRVDTGPRSACFLFTAIRHHLDEREQEKLAGMLASVDTRPPVPVMPRRPVRIIGKRTGNVRPWAVPERMGEAA